MSVKMTTLDSAADKAVAYWTVIRMLYIYLILLTLDNTQYIVIAILDRNSKSAILITYDFQNR